MSLKVQIPLHVLTHDSQKAGARKAQDPLRTRNLSMDMAYLCGYRSFMIGPEQGEADILIQTSIQRSGTSPRIPFQTPAFHTIVKKTTPVPPTLRVVRGGTY